MLHALREAVADFQNALRGGTAVSEPAPAADTAPGTLPPVAAPGAATTADAAPESDVVTEPSALPAGRRPGRRVAVTVAAAAVVAVLAFVLRWVPWEAVEPADPEVVATFAGGVVTRSQLVRQWEAIPPAERRPYQTAPALRALVGHIAVDEVTRRWAEERQVDRQESFKEAMKHATEAIQLDDLTEQFHEGRIPVGEAEVQAYYDQNRQQFGERPLVEVREQIRRAVVEQKERAFVEDYLTGLRERASLQVDYGLLEVPEPTEAEAAEYYRANQARFRTPEGATIAQLQVSVSLAGGDDRAKAKAEAARARAAASEDFAQLVRELSDAPDKGEGGRQSVIRGGRSPAFDEAVWTLAVDGLSPVFRDGDSYYVVKMVERRPERAWPYEEARPQIVAALRAERERQLYGERQDRTLFTIHGRRTTLGEFLRELGELPLEAQARYAGPAGKRQLLDSFITRLLVVEDTGEGAAEVKQGEAIQHARTELLARLLHQEQVDDRLAVGDDEVRAEYERDRARYAEPARVRVHAIRVARGQTDDADRQARTRIEEAERKLKPGGLFGGGQAADFAEVAKEYSEEGGIGESGVWLGESGDPLAEAFEHDLHAALLPLRVGDISPVLTLDDGYYLFHVAEKQESRQRSYEEAAPLIRQALEDRKHEELTRAMEEELFARMQLRIYDGRLERVLAELGGPAAGTTR